MPRVGVEPTTYRSLVGILCHWDTEAYDAPLLTKPSFIKRRFSRVDADGRRGTRTPKVTRTTGLQPATLPITCYPSVHRVKGRELPAVGGDTKSNASRDLRVLATEERFIEAPLVHGQRSFHPTRMSDLVLCWFLEALVHAWKKDMKKASLRVDSRRRLTHWRQCQSRALGRFFSLNNRAAQPPPTRADSDIDTDRRSVSRKSSRGRAAYFGARCSSWSSSK